MCSLATNGSIRPLVRVARMTRRARINTVEEADAAVERAQWLRKVGHPRGPINEVFEAYATVRAELHRTQKLLDGQGGGHFQRMVSTK